jgi:two-component system nitrate/nitrite response regulator NarL
MSAVAAPIRVLIADDHTLFRAGLARMLADDERFDVVGEAKDGGEAVDQTVAYHPDVVLMDLQMPRVTGLEAVRRLAVDAPGVNVLVLSAYADHATIDTALASGARGFVDKDITLDEIATRILEVSTSPRIKPGRRRDLLSNRELVVLKQVAIGRSNKQIAGELGISQKTVRNHLSRIFAKLGAGNRTEAVINAMKGGVLSLQRS